MVQLSWKENIQYKGLFHGCKAGSIRILQKHLQIQLQEKILLSANENEMLKQNEIKLLTRALECNLQVVEMINNENLENKSIVMMSILKELRELCDKVIKQNEKNHA